MKRGMIYWINLESSSPPEYGKIRPGVIISNSHQNIVLPTLVILPISSRSPEIWPLRLEFKMPNGKNSYVVIPGVRQVSRERLQGQIGEMSTQVMRNISEAIQLYFND